MRNGGQSPPSLDGVAPTAASVAQATYGIASPFALVWKGELEPAADRFFQFQKSAGGKKIVIDSGTVPAGLMEFPENAPGDFG